MPDHCKFCKKETKKNGTKRRRFCKGTDCQKKHRLIKYGGVIPSVKLKICSSCGKSKPGDQFHIDRGTKDGRTHRCKYCILEYHREYGKGNHNGRPESVRVEIGNIRYFVIVERDNYCCQICGIKVTAIYDRDNPPPQEQHYEDTACELDHIIPRSKGGATTEGNLQVTCRKCNRGKGVKVPGKAHGIGTKLLQDTMDEKYDTEEGNEAQTVAA